MGRKELVIGALTFTIGGWVLFLAVPMLQGFAQNDYNSTSYDQYGSVQQQYYIQNGVAYPIYNGQQTQYQYSYPYDSSVSYQNYFSSSSSSRRSSSSSFSSTPGQMTSREHDRMCRTLNSYCRSQLRTNERALDRLARYGIFRSLPDPPVCDLQRDICGGSFSTSSSSRSPDCFCTKEYRPVCGSDSNTYGNACEARCAGVVVMHEGRCFSLRRD